MFSSTFFFHFFDLVFFFFSSGPITIRIDTLWAQLLLEFSTHHFETMHICSTLSINVCVVLGYPNIFYQYFSLFLFSFFQV